VKQPLDLPRPSAPIDVAADGRSDREKSEMYLLSLLLSGDMKALIADIDRMGLRFHDEGIARIVGILRESVGDENGQIDLSQVAKKIPVELVPVFDEAYLMDNSELVEEAEVFGREWTVLLVGLVRSDIKERIRQLTKELSSDGCPEDRVNKLQEEISRETEAIKSLEKRG